MAHKGNTQDTSDAMPKIAHTIVVKGTYYFNARFPTSLVEAGLVAKPIERRSLGTKDWREARRLVADQYAFHVAEISRLEQRLESKGERENENSDTVPLGFLSERQKRELVLRWFVEMERESSAVREQFADESSEKRELIFEGAVADLSAYEGNEDAEGYALVDWRKLVEARLKAKKISFEADDVSQDFVSLFRRAVIEVHWRTVEALRGKAFQKRDDAFMVLHAFSEIDKRLKATKSVAQLCDEFLSAKTQAGRSPATLKSYNTRIKILKECFGAKTDLSRLEGDSGYEAAKSLVSFLRKIPAFAQQKYPRFSLAEASREEAKKPTPSFIEAKTQQDIFIDLKGIFDFAIRRKWISQNPFDGLSDSIPAVIERPKEVLTGEELSTILTSDAFLEGRSRGANGERREGRFWCVVLCLFHGMRLNESASLLVSDVRKEGDIDFLDFTEFDDDGNAVKRLKTKASRRRVPLHCEVLKIGFLEYVSYRRQKGEDWLFPDLKPNSLGNRGAYTSRWFSRLRDKLIGKPTVRGDKSIHSMRHAVADAIRSVTDSDEILFEIGGWGSENRDNSSRRYGKGDLKRLKKVIDQISFDGFNPKALRKDGLAEN